MRVFRLLGARRLRLQPLKAAIAVIAVGSGVALAVAVLVTASSVDRSVAAFGRSLAGPAPLRIVGATVDGGLAPDAVTRAEAVEGVAAVVPVVLETTLADPALGRAAAPDDVLVADSGRAVDVLVLGVDCRAEALLPSDVGCDDTALAAAGDGVIAVGPTLAAELGSLDGATIRSDAGRIPLDGAPVVPALADLVGGDVALMSASGAQRRFLQPDQYDVAYVVVERGASLDAVRTDLEAAVGDHNAVLGADDPPPQIGVILLTFLPLFSLLGLFGLGVGAVLVRNTLVLSLEERRRQLAILGALGAKRRTVIGGLVGEAAVLGTLGGVLGTAGGALLGGPIVASMSDATNDLAGITLSRHVTPATAAIGVALGALTAAASAVMPARRALRADVAAELSGRERADEARTPRLVRRLVVSTLALAVATAGCWAVTLDGSLHRWQAGLGPAAFLLAVLATLSLGTALAPLVVGRFSRRTGTSRRSWVVLALSGLVRDPRRSGILVTAVSAPIIVAFMTDGAATSARAEVASHVTAEDAVSISTTEPGEGGRAFLSAEAIAQLAEVPGVAAVERSAFTVVGSRPSDLVAIKASEGTTVEWEVLDGTADQDRLAAGEVVIGAGLARTEGIRGGDSVELPTSSGFVELPVQGVWEDGDFGGFSVTVPYGVLERHWGPQGAAFVELRPATGVSEEELADAVRERSFAIDPWLQVRTSDEVADAIADSIDGQMLPFRVLQQALLLVAVVAVLSTLLLSGYQRRREHGLLAAVGAAPSHLGGAILGEAGMVGGVAVVQAAILGPLMLWAMLQIMPVVIGFRNPFEPPWWSLAASGAIAVLATLLAAAWPAWRAGRVDVLDALRYE